MLLNCALGVMSARCIECSDLKYFYTEKSLWREREIFCSRDLAKMFKEDVLLLEVEDFVLEE